MKALNIVVVLVVMTILASCAQPHYQNIPLEQNPNRKIASPPIVLKSVIVSFINKGGPIYIKRGGPLAGLAMDTWQKIDVEISTGRLYISWDYQTLSGRIIYANGEVIITSNTRSVVFYPPDQDDMFRYRGRPSIEAHNYIR